ncbi:hypothetical protein Q3G72_020869 [Acer saccharum]|nr:hypothetical protein Q3G72_020869 [Acer saccharum]
MLLIQLSLVTAKADDVQSLLSAILTNLKTCLDGLVQATVFYGSVENGLLISLLNDTKLYGVSLVLVNRAWVPKKKKSGTMWQQPTKKQLLFTNNGCFPFKCLAEFVRSTSLYMIKRKFHEQSTCDDDDDYDDQVVLVSDIVIVRQDGRGNFSTIIDAINVAPNNIDGSNGYFLIYVAAGIYEEYISIAKNKKYMMMIGDSINQTVITGNRSVVDGWTTFNSAT